MESPKISSLDKITPHTWNCEVAKANISMCKVYTDGIGLRIIVSYVTNLFFLGVALRSWFSCCCILTGSIDSILVTLQNCSLLEILDLSYNMFSGNNTHCHCWAMKKKTIFYQGCRCNYIKKNIISYGRLQTFMATWTFDPHHIRKSHQHSTCFGFFQQGLH